MHNGDQNNDDYRFDFSNRPVVYRGPGPNQNQTPPQFAIPSGGNLPPPRSKPKVGVILSLLVSLVVVIGAILFVGYLINDVLSRTEQYRVSDVTSYSMRNRERYDEMVNLINQLYDKYTRQDLTGEIWTRFDPETEDYEYVIDFLSELNYYHKKLATYETQQSSNQNELDYEIETVIGDLKELEKRFIAKQPLTTNIVITLEDGTQVAVAKKTKTSLRYGGESTVGLVRDVSQYSDPPLEKEAWAREFEGALDSNGTYATSASELAGNFDMYLDYNWSNVLNKCIGLDNDNKVIAAYCHATPDVIYINKNSDNYSSAIRDSMFISTIKHEISHHLIASICGTTRPIIAGSTIEGVTNSYANIFLGANEKNEYYVGYPEYHMSGTTDSVARAIHDEKRCSV